MAVSPVTLSDPAVRARRRSNQSDDVSSKVTVSAVQIQVIDIIQIETQSYARTGTSTRLVTLSGAR